MKASVNIPCFVSRAGLFLTLAITTALAAPVAIAPAAWGDTQQPQVAIDEAGVMYVVFGRGEEIYVAISNDSGTHFQTPQRVGRLHKLALGMRRGPRIAASGRAVTVTAITNEDLWAYHSENGGSTWSMPVRINSVATSAREGLGNLAAGPGGRFYATWLDLRAGSTQIYGALSRDGGKTWDANELVYRSPDGHVCECCHPSAAFNNRGDIIVMWRNALKGSRDLWAATRRADSEHFEPPAKQGSGSWKLDGCPMDGGAIFAQEDGSFASIWQRDQGVYLSTTPAKEQRLGSGKQPLALVAQGTLHAWWQQGAHLLHATSAKAYTAERFAEDAKFAAATVSPKDGTIIVVFERTVGQRKTIFAEVLR